MLSVITIAVLIFTFLVSFTILFVNSNPDRSFKDVLTDIALSCGITIGVGLAALIVWFVIACLSTTPISREQEPTRTVEIEQSIVYDDSRIKCTKLGDGEDMKIRMHDAEILYDLSEGETSYVDVYEATNGLTLLLAKKYTVHVAPGAKIVPDNDSEEE